jgi:hypothetical protein
LHDGCLRSDPRRQHVHAQRRAEHVRRTDVDLEKPWEPS